MGNTYTNPVICSYDILEKSNNGSIWRSTLPPKSSVVVTPSSVTQKSILDGLVLKEAYFFLEPFLTSNDTMLFVDLIALILIIAVLILNRRRWVQSKCLYLFTNYFLTYLLLRTGSRFVHSLYIGLWNIAKYHFAWCFEEGYLNGTIKKIWYAPDPSDSLASSPITLRINGYNIYTFFYTNNDASKHSHNHISAIILILHRLTIYCACAHPVIFKKYFTSKRLHSYYIATGVIWTLYGYIYYFLPNGYDLHLKYFLTITKYTTAITGIFHVIITVLSIRVVLKFNQSSSADVQAVKSFIIFSIYPVLFSIADMIFGVSTSGALVGVSSEWFIIWLISYSMLDIFYSLCTIISVWLFIPTYRKTFLMLIRRKHSVSVASLVKHP